MDGVRAPHIMTDSTDNKRPEKMTHARSEYRDFMSLTPDAYAAVLALGQVAGKAGMDKQLLELIKLRASQINGCAFCVQYGAAGRGFQGIMLFHAPHSSGAAGLRQKP